MSVDRREIAEFRSLFNAFFLTFKILFRLSFNKKNLQTNWLEKQINMKIAIAVFVF